MWHPGRDSGANQDLALVDISELTDERSRVAAPYSATSTILAINVPMLRIFSSQCNSIKTLTLSKGEKLYCQIDQRDCLKILQQL